MRKLRAGVLFHQDNALIYTATVAMATIQEMTIELVEHPPCSPDLALGLKEYIRGKTIA